MNPTKPKDVTDWSSHAANTIHEAGLRRSVPRQKVVELLASEDCAITALDMDGRLDGVGRATVYRAIDQLEQLGLVQKVDLAGNAHGYEKVDPSGHHHHHIICDECGRVQPFEDERLEQAIHKLHPSGFQIETHEVVLRGHCADCN